MYLNDILDQPSAVAKTYDALKLKRIGLIENIFASGRYQHMLLTGMGASLYALYPLQISLIEHGIHADVVETSELTHYIPSLLTPQTILVAASQSGESAEIIQLMELANEKRIPTIGITNTPNSTLTNRSSEVVLTQAGEEHTVSCKTYVATLTALYWLGAQLIRGPANQKIKKIAQVPQLIARYLDRWQDHVSFFIDRLSMVKELFITGRGPSLAAARTGALIIKESARFPAEGLSCASFRHGPMEMALPDVMVAIYEGHAKTAHLNQKLVEDVVHLSGRAMYICENDAPDALHLPLCDGLFRPLLEILPAQMISLALASIQGIKPGVFERASKVTTVE